MSYYSNSPSSSTNSRSLTCYFCTESMDSKYLSDHLIHCGAVLEECPEKCGAYVPRNELAEHRSQCFRVFNEKIQRTSESLDEKIRSLRESAWKNKVVSILGLLRTAVYEGEKEVKELRDTLASSLQLTNEALRKDILEELFDSRAHSLAMNNRLTSLEKSYTDLQHRIIESVQETNAQIDAMKFETSNEQQNGLEEREKCYSVLEELRLNFTSENATICRLWQEQAQNVHDMRLELEMRCKLSKELVAKYNELFDRIESIEMRLHQQSEQVAEQATNCKTLKFQMKDNVQYVEEIVNDAKKNCNVQFYECGCREISAPVGRLIWRIDHYNERLEEAKLNDIALFSPMFYDKEYGYTLRMELHMNGLGQWKNRHIIGCLRIVNGKWDPLLDWPCTVRADVTLRDQDNPINDVEKFVKTMKKAKDDEELEHNSDLYMFIPHSTIARQPGYTKDDVMFLDIRVKELKFNGSTMSLV